MAIGHSHIVAAYIVAAAFEVVGVAWVVADVYFDRRRARDVVSKRSRMPRSSGRRAWLYGGLVTQSRGPHAGSYRAEKERRKQTWAGVERGARQAAQVEAEVLDMLRGNLVRRLGGPLCLVVGIVVSTVTNIANTH
ncbi:MAG TPA: hypothetical protein VFL58_06490 [Gaiellaceae bacterium]|nr:hypothetical protein [Gaiellaceae bacterium]